MWEPQPLATLRASTACIGITLPINGAFSASDYILYSVESRDDHKNLCVRKRAWSWHLSERTEETHRTPRPIYAVWRPIFEPRALPIQSKYADHSIAKFDTTKWKWINAYVTINAVHAAVTIAGLVKKLSEFHWTRKFMTLFTRNIHQCTLFPSKWR
jgi:hypothetical protein